MKKIFLCILILTGSFAFSEEVPAASEEKSFIEKSKENTQKALDYVSEKGSEAKQVIDSKTSESILKRHNYNYGGHLIYSPIDFIIPGKIGASVYMASDDKNTQYELQYVRGSIPLTLLSVDFGKVTDQRLSLLKRNYSSSGNFNWYYGISYISFDASLGSSILNNIVPSGNVPNSELIEIKSLGLDLGIGNRWYFENGFSFSVDWLGISQPVAVLKKEAAYLQATTSSQTDRDNITKFIDAVAVFPRLYFLKASIGYSF
jgi:hypothetical protein